MNQTTSMSNFRVRLFRNQGVDVHICYSNREAFLEISNSTGFPRIISLNNVWASPSEVGPTVIKVGAHCLRKLPWSITDYPRLKKIEVEVKNSLEKALKDTGGNSMI